MRAVVLTLMALTASTASARVQQSPDSTLDRAVAVYAKVKTARATFTQTLTNPLTGTTATSHGDIQQRQPGRFAVHFSDPAGDRIVSDGQFVWVYLPSTNPGQVIKSRVGQNGGGVPDFTSQFLHDPKARYTVSGGGALTVLGRRTHAVVLVPKDSTMPFTKVTLWIDDTNALVRQFETVDQNGLVRRVALTKVSLNAPVDPDAFTFRVPEGVKVFEQ